MAETWGAVSFEDFSARLGFSLSDLEANRAGRLTPDQRLRIAKLISKHASSMASHRIGFLIGVWVLAGFMVIGLIAALVRWSLEPLVSAVLCGLPIFFWPLPRSRPRCCRCLQSKRGRSRAQWTIACEASVGRASVAVRRGRVDLRSGYDPAKVPSAR